VWDKPALACLSSRFPYGTEITPARLTQVARCERTLRELGFRVCRVRYHDSVARIEVEPEMIPTLLKPEINEKVTREFKEAGFSFVTVDLQGFRSGSLNETVRANAPKKLKT